LDKAVSREVRVTPPAVASNNFSFTRVLLAMAPSLLLTFKFVDTSVESEEGVKEDDDDDDDDEVSDRSMGDDVDVGGTSEGSRGSSADDARTTIAT